MNYYQRHIGDTLKVAAHLSILEHGVYVRIADTYYGREEPIPAGDVARLIMARSDDERAAVTAVLDEFFKLVDGRYVNAQFDADIEKFKAGEPDREAKRQNDRDRQDRARANRAELFDKLRQCGQVPPYDTSMAELRRLVALHVTREVTQPVTPVTRDITPPNTRDDTATQYPVTNPTLQQSRQLRARAQPPRVAPTVLARRCGATGWRCARPSVPRSVQPYCGKQKVRQSKPA